MVSINVVAVIITRDPELGRLIKLLRLGTIHAMLNELGCVELRVFTSSLGTICLNTGLL